MSLTHLLDRLYFSVKKFIFSRVGFWSGGLFYFPADQAQIKSEQERYLTQKKWILIVSREYYFETVNDYPIGNLGDLKKYLKIEPVISPYDGLHLYSIKRLSPESHRVTSWVIKDEVLNSLEFKPIWLIPETACFFANESAMPASYSRLGQRVLVADSSDGLKSGLEPKDLKSAKLKGWRSRFLQLGGYADDADITQLSDEQSRQKLLSGLINLLKTSPLPFMLSPSSKLSSQFPWFKAAKVTSFLCILYLGVSSAYLVVAQSWVDYQISVRQADSIAAVSLRNKSLKLRSEFDDVSKIFSQISPMWVSWDLALDLRARGVSISRVDSADSKITFYATAKKAIDVITFLVSDSRVDSAEFASTVRQVKDRQQFGVVITLSSSSPLRSLESSKSSSQPAQSSSTRPRVEVKSG